MISKTPMTPYYAVIFTSLRTEDDNGYELAAKRMTDLAQKQIGFLGVESARSEVGITISYWESLEAIQNWRNNEEHRNVQKSGKKKWYASYKIRICKVERDYEF